MASQMHNTSGSNSGNNGNTELVIATVALVASLFALICAVFQALNQYFATATGFTSCGPEVIGGWAQFTRRRLRLWQFRIEVLFRVPVIFVSPPGNKRGPLGHKTIHYVDGTEDSCAATYTWTVEEFDSRQDARRDAGDTREAIRTADSELASWTALLMAAQRMERESDEWQRRIFATYSPLTPETTTERRHTLAICMQVQTRSWDTMPPNLRKPYATTAICHLIEIMAMLGVYWKEFDMSNNKFRAQGNGFNLTGTVVDGLGFAFTFNKTGKTWFQENRIVPNDKVKELCFGFCPTIFRSGLKTILYTDEPKDERTLQLATHAEVAEMLVSFGCNTNTVNYFRVYSEHTRYSHLFPITFEMMGMVGELLQIKQTAFTMLPNPTFSTWNKSAFSLVRLLQNFNEALEQFGTGTARSHPEAASNHVSRVLSAIRKVLAVAVEDEAVLKQQNKRKIERQRHEEVNAIGLFRQPHLKNNIPANAEPFSARLWKGLHRLWKGLHTLGSAVAAPFRYVAVWLLLWIGRGLLAVGVSAGEHLLPKKKPILQRPLAPNVEERPSFSRLLEILHKAVQECDAFLGPNHPLVKHVFVQHLQEVLAYLNEPLDLAGSIAESTHGRVFPGVAPVRPLDRLSRRQSQTMPASGASSTTAHAAADTEEDEDVPPGYVPLHIIDTASWADRHQHLMQLYGLYIRDRVRNAPLPDHLKTYQQARDRSGSSPTAAQSLLFGHIAPAGLAPVADADAADPARGSVSQDTTVAGSQGSIELNRLQHAEPGAGASGGASVIRARGGHAVASAVASAGNARTTSHQTVAEAAVGASAGGARATTAGVPVAETGRRRGAPGEALLTFERATTKQDIDDIWCTLTFRMLCWLMLHDFHRKDVQTGSKSDMYDSRMPVYFL